MTSIDQGENPPDIVGLAINSLARQQRIYNKITILIILCFVLCATNK